MFTPFNVSDTENPDCLGAFNLIDNIILVPVQQIYPSLAAECLVVDFSFNEEGFLMCC